jgi:hypothetical protein
MVNDVRNYSSTTRQMALLGAADAAAESVALDSLQGLPDPPFTLILSAGTTSEEVVLATDVSGSTVTVLRAQAGTSARSHVAGAAVIHGVTGEDLQEFMDHVQAVTGVHGLDGSLVGTSDEQTLSGKTLSGVDNTFTDIPGEALAAVPTDRFDGDVDAQTLNGVKITSSETAPESPNVGDIWVDIS